MRIVVTGALGHIGSRLIRALPAARAGMDLVLLDNLSTQRYCSLFDLPPGGRYRFVEADILDADLAPLFSGADAVVHLAAITDAAGSIGRREEVERVNVMGTRRVADACVQAGSPLVFMSTTSVYGSQRELVDEDCPESELKPQSPYAESKLRAEDYLRSEAGRSGLRVVICRLGTIFGTSIGMRFHTAVNRFCWEAAMGRPLSIWRTAMEQKRPYLDLSDAVEAVRFILDRRVFDGRVYNVVTVNVTVKDIVSIISSHRPGTAVRYVDTPIMNQLSYEVSSVRFRALGFTFAGNLEKGIADTLGLFCGITPGGGT